MNEAVEDKRRGAATGERDRDAERTRGTAGRGDEALPDRRSGQVHRVHAGSPAQERAGGTHLGASPEDGDVDVVEVKPAGVVEQQMHRRPEARLGDAVGNPSVHLATQVIPEESPSLIWQ